MRNAARDGSAPRRELGVRSDRRSCGAMALVRSRGRHGSGRDARPGLHDHEVRQGGKCADIGDGRIEKSERGHVGETCERAHAESVGVVPAGDVDGVSDTARILPPVLRCDFRIVWTELGDAVECFELCRSPLGIIERNLALFPGDAWWYEPVARVAIFQALLLHAVGDDALLCEPDLGARRVVIIDRSRDRRDVGGRVVDGEAELVLRRLSNPGGLVAEGSLVLGLGSAVGVSLLEQGRHEVVDGGGLLFVLDE